MKFCLIKNSDFKTGRVIDMYDSYLNYYNILKVFKKSNYQDIFIGTNKMDSNEVVIINILKDIDFSWKSYKNQIESYFENVFYVEEVEEGLVVITKFTDGISLVDYFEANNPDIDTRSHILLDYLRKVSKYDSLDNRLKNILVDESQIVIKDENLNLNELIISEKSTKTTTDFKSIIDKIESTAKRIFYSDVSEDVTIPDQIKQFIDGLEKNRDRYSNIYDVYRAFEKISRAEELPIKAEEIYTNDNLELKHEEASRSFSKNIFVKIGLGILIMAVAAAVYGFIRDPIENKITKLMSRKPKAYFEKVPMKEGWEFINKSKANGKNNEIQSSVWTVKKDGKVVDKKDTGDFTLNLGPGKYEITLKVKDKHNKWSNEYKEEVKVKKANKGVKDIKQEPIPEEKLEQLDIAYDKVMIDREIFHSGKYSIKFAGELDSKSIKIQDIGAKQISSLSMWVMVDSKKDINIEVKGWLKENIIFHKILQHQPLEEGNWEMIQIPIIGQIDTLQISFSSAKQVTIWLDDINFDAYK